MASPTLINSPTHDLVVTWKALGPGWQFTALKRAGVTGMWTIPAVPTEHYGVQAVAPTVDEVPINPTGD